MDKLDPVVVKMLERYAHLHPLVLNRSVERARTLGELFDFLEGFPSVFPVSWNEQERQWKNVDLILNNRS